MGYDKPLCSRLAMWLPQATMPVAVFTVGCLFGTEHYTSCELRGLVLRLLR